MLAVLPSSACRLDCATMSRWEDLSVELEDPDDSYQAYVALWVESALQRFAAWSDRDSVCVSSVTVISSPDGRTAGEYHTGTAALTVSASSDDPWSSTVHELCHAVDVAEDLAPDYPSLFDPDTITNRDDYPTRRLRGSEAFARICGSGPQDIERLRVWADDCGMEVTSADLDALELVRDEVFPLAARSTWDAPSVETWWGEAWSLPAQDEGWTATRLLADGEQALLLSERSGGGWMRVHVLEPWDGSESATYTFQPCGWVEDCSWDELQAEDGAWLQVNGERGDGAWWRLTAEGVEQIGSPCTAAEGAVVSGGVAWRFTEREWEYSELGGCDLESGAQHQPPGLGPVWLPYGPDNLIALPYLTSGATHPTVRWFGVGWAWLDSDGSTWQGEELPWYFGVGSSATLPDGQWLLDVWDTNEETGEAVRAAAWLDPLTGVIRTPLDACPRRSTDPGAHYQLAAAGTGWALYMDNISLSTSEVTMRALTWE